MIRILLVDNSPRLKTESENFWRGSGYDAMFVQAHTMSAAIDAVTKSVFWYIDINADDIDYIPQLPVLRKCTDIPIIALTSDFNADDEIDAYYAGLDVYTTWEVGVKQQSAQSVIAYMSRYDKRSPVKEPGIPKILAHNDIVLSCDFHKCTVNGTAVYMTKTEFDILYYLMLNRGLVLTPQQIYYFVWGEDIYDETLPSALRAHIKRLRKKINIDAHSSSRIENVRGIGYCFVS